MDEKAQGFETSEYGHEHVHPDKVYSVIEEIIRDQVTRSPSSNVRVSFTGNLMRIAYHCYEMHLPVKMKEIEATAKSVLDETFKNLKKQFKERTSDTLKAKEQKDMANYSVQKVSLNERYYYVAWRFYELG